MDYAPQRMIKEDSLWGEKHSLNQDLAMHLDGAGDNLLFKSLHHADFSCHRKWETNEMYSKDQDFFYIAI